MQNNLNIRGEPIQTVYRNYRQGKLIVNRRYQRKLVWTLREKQRFIDSLINEFPVPLFLGISFEHASKGICFEILDGMQRLEAITSFIEGAFPVDGKYFDLSIIAETNKLVQDGSITQKEPKLAFDVCNTILNYPLPISTSLYTSALNVDETFRRINTGGVRLSRHEVRQAGAIASFPQLVRRCATYIRGDASHTDILELSAMRNISLTADDLDYGLKVRKTFWYRHHILTDINILASRDEELIAHILLHILLKDQAQTSSKFLDDIYDEESQVSDASNSCVTKHGAEILYKQFCYVFDELLKVIDAFGGNFAIHLYVGKPHNLQNAYQVVYLAFFELLMKQNKQVANYQSLGLALKGVATNCMGGLNSESKWMHQQRVQMTKAVVGVIGAHFIPREGMDPAGISWVENLENILNQSRTESICYDFKIGLHGLEKDTSFSQKSLSKIVKTLIAMCNSHAGENYVIIGIAGNSASASKHAATYSLKPIEYNEFFITGIGGEAIRHHSSLDKYQQRIRQSIEIEPIDKDVLRSILRNVILVKYHDKDVVMLKLSRGRTPFRYDGNIYVRKMADNEPDP